MHHSFSVYTTVYHFKVNKRMLQITWNLEVSVQVPETVSSEYDWEIVPHDNFTDQKNTAG
jgi:hypothetical protein